MLQVVEEQEGDGHLLIIYPRRQESIMNFSARLTPKSRARTINTQSRERAHNHRNHQQPDLINISPLSATLVSNTLAEAMTPSFLLAPSP
jgi:hypothetical protein